MSSYFDSFDRQVSLLADQFRGGDDLAFLKAVQELESGMKRTCELFAGDKDTPEEVRQRIIRCVTTCRVYFDADMPGLGDSPANEYVAACRLSKMSQEMHRIFHDIARMHLKTRYGVVMDNPEAAVRARDAYAERRIKRTRQTPSS